MTSHECDSHSRSDGLAKTCVFSQLSGLMDWPATLSETKRMNGMPWTASRLQICLAEQLPNDPSGAPVFGQANSE